MKRYNIVDVIGVTENGPQLHGDFGGERHKVFREVTDLILGQILLEYLRGFKLFDHRGVVIDAPLFALGEITGIKNVLDGYLLFVLFNKVLQCYGSFKTKERSRKVEQHIAITVLVEHTNGGSGIAVASP